MFGASPSVAAIKASKTFKKEVVADILELGAGQGRDTLYFAKEGFIVHFFSKEKIEKLSKGFEILNIESFVEYRKVGTFPRKLFRVTLKKQRQQL